MENLPGAFKELTLEERSEERLLAALSWLWVFSLVLLVLTRGRPFVQFHARQGAFLFVVSLGAWIVVALAGAKLWVFHALVQFGIFLLVVTGFLQALRGRWWTLPLVGQLARRTGL